MLDGFGKFSLIKNQPRENRKIYVMYIQLALARGETKFDLGVIWSRRAHSISYSDGIVCSIQCFREPEISTLNKLQKR